VSNLYAHKCAYYSTAYGSFILSILDILCSSVGYSVLTVHCLLSTVLSFLLTLSFIPSKTCGVMSNNLQLGDMEFSSRLLLGTGKFSDVETMVASVEASGAEIVTVALRRFNQDNQDQDLYEPVSKLENVTVMPNTSGARDAGEAVKAAMLGRELTGSKLVKVEIHPNPHHLMPDSIETYEAAKELVKEGFIVMPYMPADPVLAKRLEDIGCASVMPLGSAIGSGNGLKTLDLVSIIIRDSNIPVIVDAGIRSPSEAAMAMEMGCDAVLVNSAIAAAANPVGMAAAFSMAVEAGRKARLAGIMSSGGSAVATSPLTSFLSEDA
jgi:thiazole synthase